MASLMENLIEVLDRESSEYENLLGLSMKKTPVIVAGNMEELAKVTVKNRTLSAGLINWNKKDRKYLLISPM